jgi:ElaB/YqjD/DUF883 family membrane-anchored ribosome-binding protein
MADEVKGRVHTFGDKAEQRVSGVSGGDSRTQENGLLNQAAGSVQDAYDRTVDAAVEGTQSVKVAAVASHDFLKELMENNPHTTTAIALGIGLLIGYAAKRPPARRGWWD